MSQGQLVGKVGSKNGPENNIKFLILITLLMKWLVSCFSLLLGGNLGSACVSVQALEKQKTWLSLESFYGSICFSFGY
ncbi:BnaC02g29970D [Brassica napus]|uniref:(rape) hypothetical protein n=1 Tax=Brassica napus TaxID=3708 RepID=A0A078FF17_BRANA|nr:unnamed protein product [Brassica napus]CDY12990.1 BnaC02g29970D [Brassica napus]